mmetsp:Transcript_2488/g.5732  ORF Transcript_2488/g.5732 Transcript_2488/m.5732 type:complete len:208 (-) Transcript_2488:298-921(-)
MPADSSSFRSMSNTSHHQYCTLYMTKRKPARCIVRLVLTPAPLMCQAAGGTASHPWETPLSMRPHARLCSSCSLSFCSSLASARSLASACVRRISLALTSRPHAASCALSRTLLCSVAACSAKSSSCRPRNRHSISNCRRSKSSSSSAASGSLLRRDARSAIHGSGHAMCKSASATASLALRRALAASCGTWCKYSIATMRAGSPTG